MQFTNHTPFPALAFAGVDQHQHAFHVVALRQTFTWNDEGALIFADEQAPLCDADTYFGEDLAGAVRQESDLCHYKPRCDVIINATGYPPQQPTGVAPRRFDVRAVIKRPDEAVAPPAAPEGLNPFMRASQEELQQWREPLAQTAGRRIAGEALVDKTLTVTGERAFVKRTGLIRFCTAALRLGTLGLVRVSPWRLTMPKPAAPVPVRLDRAFGGE